MISLKYTDPSGYEKGQERVNGGLFNVVPEIRRAFMGVSDAAQGAQEIYNAYTGNPNSAPNLIRDIAFGGNQEAYN